MGIISKRYIRDFVKRYDKEVGVPYYSYLDFNGLKQESFSFINSKGIEIHYFYYYYDNYKEDKVILFCPGIGPGHVAYFAEINALAKRGYKVLTLDYTGCGESKGKCLASLNMPTLDVMDLLNHLSLKEKVFLVGHSLGGYTALNVINLRKDIDFAVILSGFLSIESLIRTMVKSNFIVSRIIKYERKTVPQYFGIDNLEYLNKATDKLFFIQSEDDPIVPYKISLEEVIKTNNPSIKTLKIKNKYHNPNYTDEAVLYMNEVFMKYNELIANKTIKSDEDKINYFKDASIEKLTTQDEKIFDEIILFIEQ